MCYSAPVSILYFSIILIIIYYLFNRNQGNDRWYAIIFLCVNFVQLGEYVIWKNLKNPKMNKLGSKIIKLAIYAQPLAIFLGGLYFGKINEKYKNIFKYLAYIYIVIFGIEFVNIILEKNSILNIVTNNKYHLDWKGNLFNNNIFPVFIMTIMYTISFLFINFDTNIKIGIMLTIYIYFIYFINFFNLKNNTWKSMWCFLGNLTPIVYLIITYKMGLKNKQ